MLPLYIAGEKISPIEVDEALLAHPAVSEAVAFAAPDEKYGEEVNAAVVLNPNEKATGEDILAHIKDRLSAFKLPKKVSDYRGLCLIETP